MRRLLIAFFVFVLLGIVLSLVFRNHQGYVLIAFNGWQIQTSLLFACAALLVGLWVLAILWRLLLTGVLLPRRVREWRARRRARKARKSLYDGLQRLAEARWASAESELKRLAEQNEAPGLNYLYAARAAQQQGHVTDRNHYLEQAAGRRGVSELAVLMTQSELQIEQGQTTEAIATLSRLYQLEPRHPLVLQRYAEQLLVAGDYQQLRDILPALTKHGDLNADEVNTFAVAAWHDELSCNSKDLIALTTAWRRVPKRLRSHPEMVMRYVKCLRQIKGDDEAADTIRAVLKQQWNAPLVLVFGELKSSDETAQLATVETWLKQYGEEPELLLVAGRQCLRNRLWGRARSYFEAGQKNQSRPEALLELGRLFEQINEKDEARTAYRQGLEMRVRA